MSEQANPHVITQFDVGFSPDRQVTVSRKLVDDYDVLSYAFFLDHLICNLEGEHATQLTKALYELSTKACTTISSGSDLSAELPAEDGWSFSYLSSSDNGLENPISIQLASIGEGKLASSINLSAKDLNENADYWAESAAAFFIELLHHGAEDARVLLPVLVMAQCSWYMERGIPDNGLEGVAPNVGLAYIRQISQQPAEES